MAQECDGISSLICVFLNMRALEAEFLLVVAFKCMTRHFSKQAQIQLVMRHLRGLGVFETMNCVLVPA